MAPRIDVLTQGQFRDLPPDPRWAVVAILNHDEIYPPPTDGYAAALELVFDDVSDGAFSWWQRFLLDRVTTPEAYQKLKTRLDDQASQEPWPVTPWHAAELRRFTQKLKRKHPNLEGIRVYCEYGKSRSPLAARAMHHWWKGKAFTAKAINPDDTANDRWARLLANATAD